VSCATSACSEPSSGSWSDSNIRIALRRALPKSLNRISPRVSQELRIGGAERDEIGMNRQRALASCLGMIFSENRFALFQIMP
jgi:hypothetical protein